MTKFQNLFRSAFGFKTVKASIFAVLFFSVALPLAAQTVNTVGTSVFYSRPTVNNPDLAYCNFKLTDTNSALVGASNASSKSLYDVSYVNTAASRDGLHYWKPDSNRTSNDPWVSSALIEYDQPYPTPTSVQYPNHCLGLCASFACSNLPVGQSTYSVAFPIQRVSFDIFKYYNGKNPKNADDTPTVRSIDIYPAQDTSKYREYTCGSYHCSNAGKDDIEHSVVSECLGAHWVCDGAVLKSTTTPVTTVTGGSSSSSSSTGTSGSTATTYKCGFSCDEDLDGIARNCDWLGCAVSPSTDWSTSTPVQCSRVEGTSDQTRWTCNSTSCSSVGMNGSGIYACEVSVSSNTRSATRGATRGTTIEWTSTGVTDITGYTCNFNWNNGSPTLNYCRIQDGGPHVGTDVVNCTTSGATVTCDGPTIMAPRTCTLQNDPDKLWCEVRGGPYRTTTPGVTIQKWVCDITSTGLGSSCRLSGTTTTQSPSDLGISCSGSSAPFSCSSTSIPPLTLSCPDGGITTCEIYRAVTGDDSGSTSGGSTSGGSTTGGTSTGGTGSGTGTLGPTNTSWTPTSETSVTKYVCEFSWPSGASQPTWNRCRMSSGDSGTDESSYINCTKSSTTSSSWQYVCSYNQLMADGYCTVTKGKSGTQYCEMYTGPYHTSDKLWIERWVCNTPGDTCRISGGSTTKTRSELGISCTGSGPYSCSSSTISPLVLTCPDNTEGPTCRIYTTTTTDPGGGGGGGDDPSYVVTGHNYCWPSYMTRLQACGTNIGGTYDLPGGAVPRTAGEEDLSSTINCWAYAEVGFDDYRCDPASDATTYQGCCSAAGHSDCVFFDNNGRETNDAMHFCTAWDGHYEIAGEFGKSNGYYGFRATAYTNVPSDGVINDRIEIEEVGVYPGHNGATQIPIQLDVTNVHTVRSTPSLVGAITPVSAQPYTFSYRLSKDADVRVALYDASTLDNAAYAYADVAGDNTTNEASFAAGGDYTAATGTIVRTLVDWQPRTGEGIKGKESDTQIADFDSWDGRHDEGFLLPAGNYIASLQAKSQDEWRGIDFSRAVTKQVSLDPLKLTDVRVSGLNKKSTAYATISYVLTESATLYWEIYTPGTKFADDGTVSSVLTDSSAPTGTSPSALSGSLVYRFSESRTGRMNYTERWNGLCQRTDGSGNPLPCIRTYAAGEKKSDGKVASQGETETFAYGSPMPDGNYVYVLWAEIPYNGKYVNAMGSADNKSPAFTPSVTCSRSGKEINNQCFTGVKTLKYTVGNLEVERGLVGISMQPATYATLGSSPTAYGLDPFVFKYALDRDAQVVATVENTTGLVVKHLTFEEGSPNVSQQMNTLTWDGRDDQGRMVYPGTYMFRVRANDAMFPAMSNEAITIFPVDMYRVVDVGTTDVYGDSNAKATISYHLSKPMNVQINIYNKDIVIPNYNSTTGDYNDAEVTATYNGKRTGVSTLSGVSITPEGGSYAVSGDIPVDGSYVSYGLCGMRVCRNTWSSAQEHSITGNRDLNEDLNKQGAGSNEPTTGTYTVYLKQELLDITTDTSAAWPPRICNQTTDAAVFTGGYVDPAKVNTTKTACMYVNDPTFTNYPYNATEAASGVVDVRLQPIHTFDRENLSTGDDFVNMVEWDALYFYNPTPNQARHSAQEIAKCRGSKEKANCPYEMIPDGQYPFYISARSNDVFNRYYYDAQRDGAMGGYTLSGQPFKEQANVKQENYLYASDKVQGKLNVTRGPVYFLEDTVQVYANAPQLFNASSSTLTFIPPYEINFAISRAATVEIAIVAMEPGMCSPVTDNVLSGTVNVYESRTNKAGDICKFLSTMTIRNTGNFDANVIRKAYWDGTDHTGNYVKPGQYTVRLTARNYPDAGLYQPTVKDIPLVANLLKVYDLLEADNYSISTRGQDMKIGYQISVPMKVAIQIFKPGTTIYDYSKGTLRNPTTGREVKDIREVLVRAIVGIRPGTTLIEEVWDGLDYAQQEVPDGIYPFRFVTSLDSAAIDSVTGEILFGDDTSADANKWKVARVADTYEYQNLHKATIAVGDGRFVCEDWQKTVFFYPNPFNNPAKGTLEITKMPVPGTVSIKYFNLAGDLVRDSDYSCVDANNYQTTMGKNLYFQPDNNVSTTRVNLGAFSNVRNAALRCRWDRTNQYGKKVARGVYFGLVDFKAYNGREHCQKVVKILIP